MSLIVFPAIDLKDGRCVRLRQGRMDDETVFADDPVAMAGAFADAVSAGRAARTAGAMTPQASAQPSTPVLGTPFWHHNNG